MNTILSVLKSFRDGLYANPGISGLTIAALVIFAVFRAIMWATEATGPASAGQGLIERIYVTSEDQQGPHYAAVVRLESGALATLQFGSSLPCNVGDIVRFTQTPTHLGVRYAPTFAPCSARPTGAPSELSLPARPSLISNQGAQP